MPCENCQFVNSFRRAPKRQRGGAFRFGPTRGSGCPFNSNRLSGHFSPPSMRGRPHRARAQDEGLPDVPATRQIPFWRVGSRIGGNDSRQAPRTGSDLWSISGERAIRGAGVTAPEVYATVVHESPGRTGREDRRCGASTARRGFARRCRRACQVPAATLSGSVASSHVRSALTSSSSRASARACSSSLSQSMSSAALRLGPPSNLSFASARTCSAVMS